MLASSPGNRCEYFCSPGKVAAVLLAFGAIGNLASAQNISFRDPVDLPMPAGSAPEALAVGNFKGDNAVDLALVSAGSSILSILLGNADGTFQQPREYEVGSTPWYVTAADLNGDGILDLVVSNMDSSDLTVLLGVGDGTFVYADPIPIPGTPLFPDSFPFSVVVADFNSDGFADIVVTNTFATFLVLGNGDGTFAKPVELDFGPHARFVALGDFNGDKIPDVAVTKGHGTDSLTIELGNGDGTFDFVDELYPVG